MGAYETDKYPFLTEECRLLRELAHRNCPVLGICLGYQLLAKALGADVFPGHGPEIGFGFVELTQAGNRILCSQRSGVQFQSFIGMVTRLICRKVRCSWIQIRNTHNKPFDLEAVPMDCNSTLSQTRAPG